MFQKTTYLRVAATLLIGLAGGAIFYMAALPLPWMLGAMCSTALAAVFGWPIVSAKRARPPFAAVIGVTLGASIHPIHIAQVFDWLPITAALLTSSVLIGLVGFFYFFKVAGFDRTTAYFAGMPGGVYEMTHQGGLAGGDERRIALAQTVRIFLVVFTVPFIFNLFFHFGSTSGLAINPTAKTTVWGCLQLVLVGCAGWYVALRLNLPNPPLLGPLLASALVHVVGLTDAAPPYILIATAQVVLGTSIGGQFIGADRRLFTSAIAHGFVIVPLMLAIAAGLAAATYSFTNVGFPATFLSLAPGGTAELSLVALAIKAEVAVVITHQVIRIILIYTVAVRGLRLTKGKQL